MGGPRHQNSFTDESPAKQRGLPVDEVYEVPHQNTERCHITGMEMYEEMYQKSLTDPEHFWGDLGKRHLRWFLPFTKAAPPPLTKSFQDASTWYVNGKLNVSDNCVDRWAEQFPTRIALIWERDDPNDDPIKISYRELQTGVCKCANMLKRLGVRKYDTVCIYMPMIPEVVYAMFACTRLGAVHSVVFAGFSAQSLADRINDCHTKIILTADQGLRGGKIIPLKETVDIALCQCPDVSTCVMFKRTECEVQWKVGRDVDGTTLMKGMRPYCPCEQMDSEDLMFLLYTSGSTGKPKGIAHSTAGYLMYASLTFRYVFDFHPGDVFACVADVGWITGHTYTVFGPLCNGATTVLFESLPTYPDYSRYWRMIERLRVTQFYGAPTALRALMRMGDEPVKKHDLSSLRVLGTVGEPINPEAWRWYYNIIGNSKCSIVDTFWQTETGGHMLTGLPGATSMKPGAAGLPFFGCEAAIVDPLSGKEIKGNDVYGVLCFKRSWPGMSRTIYMDHDRFLQTYMQPYPGFYFTGDGAVRDKDGRYWIIGRVDDTLNVSGHRIGTAEVEHALVQNPNVSEGATVGVPHEIKGQGICCFVTLKSQVEDTPEIRKSIIASVRKQIGPIATPDYLIITTAMPKTRSGKIMRRVLRKVACGEEDELGDLSTLADPSVVETLILKVAEAGVVKRGPPPIGTEVTVAVKRGD
eukprot:GHVN01024045.1.p1 GENE.GHVN01024045.1~~GHVN01024045.1.p1  ORF type:complete len:695 (+),score=70.73 GHVN01024045.1:109-2193(+)